MLLLILYWNEIKCSCCLHITADFAGLTFGTAKQEADCLFVEIQTKKKKKMLFLYFAVQQNHFPVSSSNLSNPEHIITNI